LNDDLHQLSIGSVTAKSYRCYDINGYRFRSSIFESSHPMAATQNSGVVMSHPVLEGKPNANHVRVRIRNSRTQRLHN
jgi:hypothetical protein